MSDMNQRVTILDRELETSLNQLNENTAALLARVNENERQVRLLQSLMAENQHKIDQLLKMVDDLKRILYRHWGIDPGPPLKISPSRNTVQIEAPHPSASGLPSSDSSAAAPRIAPQPSPSAPPVVADDAAYAAAKEQYDNENYSAAQAAFSSFLGDYGNSSLRHQAQFWLGKCYLNQSEYTKAIQAFEVIRRDYPESAYMAFALHNQAVAHFRLGERDTAIALMEEVVANYPTSTAADHARRDLQQLRNR